MIPDEAVEAAIEALRTPPSNCPLQGVLSWRDIALTVLEAAAPHLMAAAWAEGHESGFWNGRLSHGDPEALTGIEHEKASNPYRKPTNV